MTKTGPKSFYNQGIRFECQGSGKCCTSRGSYGYVFLTGKDQKRFAKYFKISTAAFLKKYCGTQNGYVFLLEPDQVGMADHPVGDCMFLKNKQCTVYEARPEHCRTWPFWPENMNPKTWRKDVASYCAGIGKGKLHTREEIEAILKTQTEF